MRFTRARSAGLAGACLASSVYGRNPSAFRQDPSGLKLLLVCALAALMSIPAIFVGIVLWDRMSQADKATNEISQTVGGQQTLLGPVLAIPYSAPSPDPEAAGNFLVIM